MFVESFSRRNFKQLLFVRLLLCVANHVLCSNTVESRLACYVTQIEIELEVQSETQTSGGRTGLGFGLGFCLGFGLGFGLGFRFGKKCMVPLYQQWSDRGRIVVGPWSDRGRAVVGQLSRGCFPGWISIAVG